MSFDFARVVQNVYVPSRLYVFGVVLIVSVAVGAQWALSFMWIAPESESAKQGSRRRSASPRSFPARWDMAISPSV